MVKLCRLLMTPARLLGVICLLFFSAGITFAQADPTLSVNDLTVVEGDGGSTPKLANFEITLSAPSQKTVTVTATTQSGTATGNSDFAAGAVTFSLLPGQTSVTFIVPIMGDTVPEGTEDFSLNLSNPINATIAKAQGVATIIDDDSLLLLQQTNSTRAATFDSVWYTKEIFPIVNTQNFSADQRSRLIVFSTGLKLAAAETASAVTATAEDAQGTVRPLTVEFVGAVPNFEWMTQVNLKLTDQIPAGDVKIRISLHGVTSNAVLAQVKLQ